MTQVRVDTDTRQIQQRNQRNRGAHLVDVVDRAYREELRDGPVLRADHEGDVQHDEAVEQLRHRRRRGGAQDRKSSRLNSSHVEISYPVFCLKKKKKNNYTK